MKLLLAHPGASVSTVDVYNGYVKALKAQGHEIISFALDGRISAASSFLMNAWKRVSDKGVPSPTTADILYQASQGLIEKTLRFMPDWVVVISGMFVHPDILVFLRRAGARVAILFTESPYDDEAQLKVAPIANVCWVNERSSVPAFRKVCPNTFYLPHAFDPELHYVRTGLTSTVPQHDVVFVGTGFWERVEALRAVDWTGIDFGLYGSWHVLGSRDRLRRHLWKHVIKNSVTADLYRNAKIGLNIHRVSKGFGRIAPRVTGAESMNPRDYELAACGTFFISDYRPELAEKLGNLVPMYINPCDLEGLIRQYLHNDEERLRRATQLPAAIAGETFEARAKQIVADLAQAGLRRG